MADNSPRGPKRCQTPEHAIAALAARQHGNITRTQLGSLGISDQGIKHRLAVGRLHRVHRGVFAVGRPPVVELERVAAAVLACGPHAVLSHLSALALWGLRVHWPACHEVTLRQGNRRPQGITVHRCALAPRDTTVQLGIRVTTPARALLDCTPRLTDAQLTRAVNDGRHAHLCSPATLRELLERVPHHPGRRRLEPFAESTAGPTRSRFEDRFAALCARYGLPTPAFNAKVCGYEVDALFAHERLIVELDSWEFHRDRGSFVNDRRRDADTLLAGYATLRITWERPDDVEARRIARILQARRSGPTAEDLR